MSGTEKVKNIYYFYLTFSPTYFPKSIKIGNIYTHYSKYRKRKRTTTYLPYICLIRVPHHQPCVDSMSPCVAKSSNQTRISRSTTNIGSNLVRHQNLIKKKIIIQQAFLDTFVYVTVNFQFTSWLNRGCNIEKETKTRLCLLFSYICSF